MLLEESSHLLYIVLVEEYTFLLQQYIYFVGKLPLKKDKIIFFYRVKSGRKAENIWNLLEKNKTYAVNALF